MFPSFDLVQRGLGDQEMAFFHQIGHLAVEKSQEKSSYMGAVDVCVGHDDDRMITELRRVVVFLYPCAQGGDEQANLLRGKHLVEAGLLNVEYFSLEGKHGLVPPVPPLFGRSPGRVSLYKIDFAQGRIFLLTVCQLSRQGT